MAETLQQDELMELGNRLIRLRYTIDTNHLNVVFSEVSIADYVILLRLAREMNLHEPKKKVYLREISSEMNIPIQKVSKMVQNLQDKGYVYWKHDEDGSEGTYIYLSETGEEMMARQQEILHQYFANIIDAMGFERFVQILDSMHELEDVMESEAEKLQVADGDCME